MIKKRHRTQKHRSPTHTPTHTPMHSSDTCDPATPRESPYTCFTLPQLKELSASWNARHPDVPITTQTKRGIWNALREKNKNACDRESCWISQEFAKHNSAKNEWVDTFAPKAPDSWNYNPNEWLTSTDITSVMKRYETKYPQFEFIGPAPIDFDSPNKTKTDCVWKELCEISVTDCIKRNKYQIGIVFNTDPHYKSGSHWIAMFVDLKKQFVYFFDSNGDPCPKQIDVLRKRMQKQADGVGLKLKYHSNVGTRHQQTTTECGMYCLYFISSLLTGKHAVDTFTSKKFRDNIMIRHRSVFFS